MDRPSEERSKPRSVPSLTRMAMVSRGPLAVVWAAEGEPHIEVIRRENVRVNRN
jgi:hypothetical protein